MTNVSDAMKGILGFFAKPLATKEPQRLPDGRTAFVAVREGYKLEKVTGPRRFRREHIFDDLASYAAWLRRHVADRKQCEILVDAATVSAALDARELGADTVGCTMLLDTEFEAWQELVSGEPMGQLQLYAFLRAHGGAITSEATAQQLIAAVQKMQFKANTEVSTEIDATGFVRVSGTGQTQQIDAIVPLSFNLSLPIYDNGPRVTVESEEPKLYTFTVYVTVVPQPSGRVFIGFSTVELETILHEARRDYAEYFAWLLNGPDANVATADTAGAAPPVPFLVGLGKIRTTEYVGEIVGG